MTWLAFPVCSLCGPVSPEGHTHSSHYLLRVTRQSPDAPWVWVQSSLFGAPISSIVIPLMSHGSCCFSLRSVPPPHLFSVATSSAETLPTVPGTCEALTSDVLAYTLSLPVLGHRGEKIFSKRRLCACHRPCSKISSHCLMDTAYALWSGTPYPRFGQPSLLNGSPSAPRALGTSHTRLLIVTRLW